MNAKNKGGLWKVAVEAFEIFGIAELILKKYTGTCSNKTEDPIITKVVVEDTGVLVNFSKLRSNINYANNEITKNIIQDLLHPYIKTRTFAPVRSNANAHKLFFQK